MTVYMFMAASKMVPQFIQIRNRLEMPGEALGPLGPLGIRTDWGKVEPVEPTPRIEPLKWLAVYRIPSGYVKIAIENDHS